MKHRAEESHWRRPKVALDRRQVSAPSYASAGRFASLRRAPSKVAPNRGPSPQSGAGALQQGPIASGLSHGQDGCFRYERRKRQHGFPIARRFVAAGTMKSRPDSTRATSGRMQMVLVATQRTSKAYSTRSATVPRKAKEASQAASDDAPAPCETASDELTNSREELCQRGTFGAALTFQRRPKLSGPLLMLIKR
jgi:hypothetical protein